MELFGPLLLAAWLASADVSVTAGPPTAIDVILPETPPAEAWAPLARAVACWAYRHPTITATPPVEVELRARRRLDTGAVHYSTFHHASVPAFTLEKCEREAPRDSSQDVTLSPELAEPDPRG